MLTVLGIVPVLGYQIANQKWLGIPWTVVALLGTATAFIVGFKNLQTYNRAWEARQIWGDILSASRAWGIPFSILISSMYTSLERVGESTESPFEGNANDVPISQICRTAERELRELLGETDIPPSLQPKNNIVL